MGLVSVRNPWLYWWLGFFITSTLSMAASLFVPINNIGFIIFIVLGIAGLPVWYRQYKNSVAQNNRSETIVFGFLVGLFIVGTLSLLARVGGFDVGAADTHIYHGQLVRWLNEYGTVPGLGNLIMAVNSSWHVMASLLDNNLWDGRSMVIMPAMLWAGIALYILYELCFSRTNGRRIFSFCILIWISLNCLRVIPSLYYDDPVHALNIIVVFEFLYLFDAGLSNKNLVNHAACVLALGVAAFMVKPLGAVSVIFSALLVLFFLLRTKRQPVGGWMKIFLPGALALGIWVIRTTILTGYPFYPLRLFALPVDWLVSRENIEAINTAILWGNRGFSDYTDLPLGNLAWLKQWFKTFCFSQPFYFAVMTAFPLVLSLFMWFLVMKYKRSKKNLLFLVWSNLNILYCFLMAPNPRFGNGFIWLSLGTALLFLIPSAPCFSLCFVWNRKKIRYTFLTFLYVWFLGIFCAFGMDVALSNRSVLKVRRLPVFPVREHIVNANPPFTMWVPDTELPFVGDAPLPSAPYPPKNIEMREPGNLGKGFRHKIFNEDE
jgi:hypothetical protein